MIMRGKTEAQLLAHKRSVDAHRSAQRRLRAQHDAAANAVKAKAAIARIAAAR